MRMIPVLALLVALAALAGCSANAAQQAAVNSSTAPNTTTAEAAATAPASAYPLRQLDIQVVGALTRVPSSCASAVTTTKTCYDSINVVGVMVLQLTNELTPLGGKDVFPQTFTALGAMQPAFFRYSGMDAQPCYPTGNDQCVDDTKIILDGAKAVEQAFMIEYKPNG